MNHSEPAQFWESVHASRPSPAQPRPNVRLTELVADDVPTGAALDLGCGNGGDALWLARRGWNVTAVDISTTAVERLGARARTHGLHDRITATHYDLHVSFPPGTFDQTPTPCTAGSTSTGPEAQRAEVTDHALLIRRATRPASRIGPSPLDVRWPR